MKIKGYVQPKKKAPEPKLEAVVSDMLGVSTLVGELNSLKEDVVTVIDGELEKIDKKVAEFDGIAQQKVTEFTNKISEFEDTATELIETIHRLPQIKGEDGKDADEVDKDEIVEQVLSKIPEAPKLDEDKLLKKFIKAIPENKASLKVIRETMSVDPSDVAKQIMAMDDFTLKTSQVAGLDILLRNIELKTGSKPYLHGGGFNNIYSAGSLVSNGLTGLNFTGSGVSSVTKDAVTGIITVDITGGGGGSPGGTGTEVQYRAGASTFGAVINSAVSGAQISFGGGIVSDYLMNLDGTSTGDYSRVLNITQNNNSAEDTYAIYVDNTVNRGTLTTGETTTLRNEYDSLVPTVNAVNAIANMYNKDLYLNVSGATLGDSDLSASVIRAHGIQNIIEGTPVINQTGSDEPAQQNIYGNVVSLNITPTLTSVVDAQGNYSGSTNTVIVNSAGNANFQATAIGFSNSVGGNLTTTGNTSHYGVLNSVSGTAVNNYGMYITVFGATNNYGLIVNQGTVGFGVAAPTGQLEVRATTEQVRVSYDASNYLSTTVSSTGSATLNLTGTSPEFTFSDPVNVPDDAYGAGWNGSTEVPTKNAIYDKIETLGGSADYKYYVLAGGYI